MVEVTQEMIEAGYEAYYAYSGDKLNEELELVFNAMFDAMPKKEHEVTPAMIDAGSAQSLVQIDGEQEAALFARIYTAMRLARPLSDGPGA